MSLAPFNGAEFCHVIANPAHALTHRLVEAALSEPHSLLTRLWESYKRCIHAIDTVRVSLRSNNLTSTFMTETQQKHVSHFNDIEKWLGFYHTETLNFTIHISHHLSESLPRIVALNVLEMFATAFSHFVETHQRSFQVVSAKSVCSTSHASASLLLLEPWMVTFYTDSILFVDVALLWINELRLPIQFWEQSTYLPSFHKCVKTLLEARAQFNLSIDDDSSLTFLSLYDICASQPTLISTFGENVIPVMQRLKDEDLTTENCLQCGQSDDENEDDDDDNDSDNSNITDSSESDSD